MEQGEQITMVAGVRQLEQGGFSSDQVASLCRIKVLYLQGAYNEMTSEGKHLEFARWLYRHVRLNEEHI